jgi:hypothetical protein
MKTLRIAMIATFVALAMVSLANTDGFTTKPNKKVVNLTFAQAIQIPGLVAAMYQQVSPEMLKHNAHTYTVDVVYNGYICRITGTYDQWTLFFRAHWRIPLATKLSFPEN